MTDEINFVLQARREKLEALEAAGVAPYAYAFDRRHSASDALSLLGDSGEEGPDVSLAGRIVAWRSHGKTTFAHLSDSTGKIQLYFKKDQLGEGPYALLAHFDLGDIVGVHGPLFRTRTGEVTVRVDRVEMLAKSLRPLPFGKEEEVNGQIVRHSGFSDPEQRYRQRYADLAVHPEVRALFIARSRMTRAIRSFLDERDFLEVETPVLQPLYGGAAARPFTTLHNALNMPLYLRIADELYLKRLVVGGLDRVYEIGHDFRNEGIDRTHNPEFTMLEFYQAYADYRDLMDLTEEMLRGLAREVLESTQLSYQGETYDLAKPFRRLTLREALLHFNPALASSVDSLDRLRDYVRQQGMEVKPSYGLGKLQYELFEKTVELHLREPTFITEFPTEVSPLARRSDSDPLVTDRFELFVGGREIANGFSELNDAEDQAERFRRQVEEKNAGDEEAMHYDADYIRALEHGMPPTAGEGIGIDRLVMLFTDSASIRDVLLFPHMRPEAGP
ncbi:MAG: lysine--tRNA ligase [Sulfurifustis sp.]